MTSTDNQPFIYIIEIIGTCNLKCPSCPNGNSDTTTHPKGLMSLDLFSSILAKIKRDSPSPFTQIYLNNWAEPTLHPDLPKMINLVHDHGLSVHLSSNLNAPYNLSALVQSKPDSLRISLSGYYPQTYHQTHTGGQGWMTIANIYRLRGLMDKHHAQFPVQLCYHQYRHNMGDDLIKIKSIALDCGFDFLPIWAYLMPVEKLLDYYDGQLIAPTLPVIKLLPIPMEQWRSISLEVKALYPDCILRSHQMVIDVDGSVSLCCAAYNREQVVSKDFLATSHDELQARKVQHKLCHRCQKEGAYITYMYGNMEKLNKIGHDNLRQVDDSKDILLTDSLLQ